MITEINESKTLTKHIWCKCKCKFDGRKCNLNQKWYNYKYRCESKKRHAYGKDYIWKPTTCSCKNGKYLESIIDNSVITCDKIIDAESRLSDVETKTVTKSFDKKSQLVKHIISIFYFHFY